MLVFMYEALKQFDFHLIYLKTFMNKDFKSLVHRHHQFLTPAIWLRCVRMNDLQCPRSFVKSIAPLVVSPINSMSSFILRYLSNIVLVCLFSFSFKSCMWCIVWNSISYHTFYMSKPSESSLDDFV